MISLHVPSTGVYKEEPADADRKGCVLRIEHLSPDDGSGLRTVVFLKGCAMRCIWCSTPESHRPEPEYGESASGRIQYGSIMTVREVMEEIKKDEVFYYHSSGGVTLSGGDILCQPEFSRDILKVCRERLYQTAAELNMYGSTDRLRMLLPYLDEVYADVKMMDPQKHFRYTGAELSGILHNIRYAARSLPPGALHIRVPLVPGINDDRENITATAGFCETLGAAVGSLEFLPYHRLGITTYQYLKRNYLLTEKPAMTRAEACQRTAFLLERGYSFPLLIAGSPITGSE